MNGNYVFNRNYWLNTFLFKPFSTLSYETTI
jgi:hypothetical protein